MKKYYILMIVLFALNIANAQWTALPSGTTKTLSSVYVTDASKGYAVGGEYDVEGIILKTIDGGTTWNTLSIGTSKYLAFCHFEWITKWNLLLEAFCK
jgi:hypothetical protein